MMNWKKVFKNVISPIDFFKTIYLKLSLSKFKALGKNNTFSNDSNFNGNADIVIANNNSFGSHIQLLTWRVYNEKKTGYESKLQIGSNNYFGRDCFVTALDNITIGNGCCFGDNVYISDNSHGNPDCLLRDKDIPVLERELHSKGPVIIGNNVWVGRNSSILGGVTIGDNAIVGANSVVTHDIEANSVYAGCPARRIR